MSGRRRSLVALAISACAPIIGEGVRAQERKTQVQWAGVSTAGQFVQLPMLMPTLYAVLTQDSNLLPAFKQRVTQAVTQVANGHPAVEIVVEDLIRQSDDAYVLSLVLAGESITSYVIDQTTFVDYVVQALVFVANLSKDPSRQRVVCNYPVQVRYQHAYPDGKRPNADDAKAIFAGMLMGQLGRADVVAEWQKRLSQIRLREREVWVAVAPLQILPEARQQGGFTPQQAERVAFKASSVIEGNISRAADIPVVPTSVDGALSDFTISFADRGVVAFRKPDPNRLFQVSVYGLGSNSAEEAMTREKKFAVAYGGGFLVEYFDIDPDGRKNLLVNMRLQSVQAVTYVGTSKDAQKASAADMFSRLISGFADDLSSNLIPVNVKWLEKFRASSEPRSASKIAELIAAKLPAPEKAR